MRSALTLLVVVSLSALVLAQAAAPSAAANTYAATGGNIVITPIRHASFQIDYANRVIQVDPIASNPNANAAKGDIVLVTDIHGDHMDPSAINQLRKPDGVVVAPAAVRDALAGKVENITVLANGESKVVSGINIEAVPMYNLVRGPSAGQFFHTKGRGNGYVLTMGGKRFYIAGDTECTPEMKALKNIDVAFLPMNLPYTMTPAEAAECVKAFKPKVVYPYHYMGQNTQEFADALKGTAGVQVKLQDWYVGATPPPARGRQ